MMHFDVFQMAPLKRCLQPLSNPGKVYMIWNVKDVVRSYVPQPSVTNGIYLCSVWMVTLMYTLGGYRGQVVFQVPREELSTIRVKWNVMHDHMPDQYAGAMEHLLQHLCPQMHTN